MFSKFQNMNVMLRKSFFVVKILLNVKWNFSKLFLIDAMLIDYHINYIKNVIAAINMWVQTRKQTNQKKNVICLHVFVSNVSTKSFINVNVILSLSTIVEKRTIIIKNKAHCEITSIHCNNALICKSKTIESFVLWIHDIQIFY